MNHYTEQVDELIESGDLKEMELVACWVEVIVDKLLEVVGKVEEEKIEQGFASRDVRQFERETKES